VLAVVILIAIVGYFAFHSLLDSSYMRTNSSSEHGSSDNSFGVDILDKEEDFETVFLNGNQQNPFKQESNLEDEDVMNEIMMCISEVHKEDGQMTLEHNSKDNNSSSSTSFASPFVARTFNNMMKVKSMNVKSPTKMKKKKGYQNIQNDDNDDDDLQFDQSENSSTPSGEVEMNSLATSPPATHASTLTQEEEEEEFFAAIDRFTPQKEQSSGPANAPVFPLEPPTSSSVEDKTEKSDSPTMPASDSNNPFDMSLHNDDFAV
jgi:hypothetical protein